MSDARYAKPTDELGHLVTPTLATGTADANYPVTNVTNFNPDQVFLTTTSGAVDIVWDSLSAVDVQLFSLHHYNIPAGHAGVRFQRSNDPTFAAITIDGALTIPAYPNPGLPLPIGLDVTTVSGYNGATGLRYSRLHIPTPTQKTGIGSALLWSTKRVDIRNVLYPVLDVETHPQRVFPTAYGHRRAYRLGVRLRRHPVNFRFNADAQWTAFRALFGSCQDGNNAFLWWRDTTGTDAMLAGFDEQDLQRSLPYNRVNDVTMTIFERGNGLAIPTV
jgi:hypothetical protein